MDIRKLMSETKFFEGYSRFSDELERYETWEESVDRVMNMHRHYYKDKMTPELEVLISEAEKSYKEKKLLGSQRALQFGGEQLLKHHMKLYNCLSSHANRPEFFGEYFYILLCGAGAGFSVQKHHVEQLPRIISRTKQPKTHIIEDSIEGWATALDVLMSSYFEGGGKHPEYEGRKVYFDLTQIRPKGAYISGGFKAPGPEPLRQALDKIEYILQGIALSGNKRKLKSIEVYDICMHAADAVLSGGVRRSATICLFSPDDMEMMNAKTGDWFIRNPQRARSNNSALLVRKDVTEEQFHMLMERVKEFGEPGFIFAESTEHSFNPCFIGETIVAVADGRNGVDIKTLAEENRPFPVYSGKINTRGQWSPEIKRAIAFKTGTKKTIKITLSDGTSFTCTPDHKLAVPGGHYIPASESLNVELQGFFTHQHKNYRIINSFSNGHAKQHRMIWEFEKDEKIPEGYVIDHIESGSPDFIDNLQILSKEDHEAKTGTEIRGLNNPVYRIQDTEKWKNNLSNQAFLENNPRFMGMTNEEIIANARILHKKGLKISFDNLMKMDERMPKSFSKNRFGGSIQNLRDIVLNVKEYVEPVKVSYIENESTPNEYHNPIVVSIEDAAIEDVYDLKVEDNSNFYILTSYDENYMNSTGILVHNCVEIGMYPVWIDPETNEKFSGWEACNLCELNGSMATTEDIFYEMCRAAAILGTLQAGYTNFKFVSDITRKIVERESLLGVSITGWMSNPNILFDENILQKGANIVKETNRMVAKLIGINPAARTTTVKPSGNASVLLGTISGINGEHSPKFLRHMQMNKETEVAQLIKSTNPYMIEESVWSSGKTDYVIAFPITANSESIFKKDILGIKHLEYIKKAQKYWVETGTDESLCVDPTVRHNVSNTVVVDDWDEVEKYLFQNRQYFAGVSLIPMTGDKDYTQAPFTQVFDENELVYTYGTGAIFASGLVVEALKAFNNDLWLACSTANGIGEDIESDDAINLLKKDWVRRFHKYAENYFDSDLKKAEYCLKDVYNLHKWMKITQNLVPINWEQELLKKKYIDVDTIGAQACYAGACEL